MLLQFFVLSSKSYWCHSFKEAYYFLDLLGLKSRKRQRWAELRTCTWVSSDEFYKVHEYLRNSKFNTRATTNILSCKIFRWKRVLTFNPRKRTCRKYNSTNKELVGSCLMCVYRVMDALGKFGGHGGTSSRARGAAERNTRIFWGKCFPNFSSASITRYTHSLKIFFSICFILLRLFQSKCL